MIYFLSEQVVKEVVSQQAVTLAIEEVFAAQARGQARNFPVVRETLDYADAIFGFKSGFDRSVPALSIKAGGLWPDNRSRGLPNHQSTIMLFDPDTGGPHALVCGTYLTGLRTAAASALSVKYLARENAETLGIIGTGGQSEYQVRAALEHRAFQRILLAGRNPENARALAERLSDLPQECVVTDVETVSREADVLITIMLSFAPVVAAQWIRPGTHVACMGTDTRGKQEVEAGLMGRGLCFGDAPDQNALLGECQHAVNEGIIEQSDIVPLGQVITGTHAGREAQDQITVFDSTGMGLQDLAAAQLALQAAISASRVTTLDQWGTTQ